MSVISSRKSNINVQKLIPTIYFYLLSAVGMSLFIIGLFHSVYWIIGVTAYDKYPLSGYHKMFAPPLHVVSGCNIPMPVQEQKNVTPKHISFVQDGNVASTSSGASDTPHIVSIQVASSALPVSSSEGYQKIELPECLKKNLMGYKNNLEKERQIAKIQDLESSIAFTVIGLLVFGVHFYFARRQRNA